MDQPLSRPSVSSMGGITADSGSYQRPIEFSGQLLSQSSLDAFLCSREGVWR